MSPILLGNILLVIAAVPALASVAVFSRVKWWRSRWGRHLFAYMSALASSLALGCLRLWIGDSTAFQWIRVAAFAAVTAVLWWRLLIVMQAYYEGSPDETARHQSPPRTKEHAVSTVVPVHARSVPGREVLDRAGRNAVQTLLPVLVAAVAGTVHGLGTSGVLEATFIAGDVTLLKAVLRLKAGRETALVWRLLDRAGPAAAATLLTFLTVDGTTPAIVVDWRAAWIATASAALLAVAQAYAMPPAVQGEIVTTPAEVPVVDTDAPGQDGGF